MEFAKSYEESGPATPMFFVLSPGVDPLKDVEALGQKMGFTFDNQNFYNISLGQGQEVVAERALDRAAKEGHWVILQNIHLVAKWLSTLEKKLEAYSEGSNESYRVYISAEPASTRASHIIPQGILESSIKITNEPPTGMKANLHKALGYFNQARYLSYFILVRLIVSVMLGYTGAERPRNGIQGDSERALLFSRCRVGAS